jgi:hypothetical protein
MPTQKETLATQATQGRNRFDVAWSLQICESRGRLKVGATRLDFSATNTKRHLLGC